MLDIDMLTLLAEAEAEREKGHAEVDARYEATVAAIKLVEGLLSRRSPHGNENGNGSVRTSRPRIFVTDDDPAAVHVTAGALIQTQEWPGPRHATRAALPDGEFTLNHIIASLQQTYPGRKLDRAGISGELYALGKMNEIEIVKEGRGSIPHIYRKKEVRN